MAKANNKTTGTHHVVSPFKSAPEFAVDGEPEVYAIGEDVSHLDPARLEDLVNRGLVSKAGGAKETE